MSIRMGIVLVPLMALVFANGCNYEGASDVLFQTRDSAGVIVADNLGDIWSSVDDITVLGGPVLRIGAVDGESAYLFDRIGAVLALSDGRLVVANVGSGTLRWFDPSGRFLFERGGSGDGPGEFRRLGPVTLAAGDTIVAMDTNSYRATLFSPDGELLSMTRIEGLAGPPGRVYRLSDGSFVTGTTGFSSQQVGNRDLEGYHRFPTPIVRVSGEPPRTDTIGLFPGLEMFFRIDPRSFGPRPYSRMLSYAVFRDEIYVGTAERFEIGVYAPDGRQLRSVRAPSVDLRLDAAAAADRLKQQLSAMPEYVNASPDEKAEAERDLAGQVATLPPLRPAYFSIHLDAQGKLWVSEHEPGPAAGRRWAVFDTSGRFEKTVMLPERFAPLTITADRVLGRLQDDLGVQYVAAYSLRE